MRIFVQDQASGP